MWAGMIALACMTLVTGGLEPEAKPNLKPIPWPGGWYGDISRPDVLRVKVKNTSRTTTAPASHTKVRFTASGHPDVVRVKDTPSLAPGQVKVISVAMPPSIYWDPDLEYNIVVDCKNEVLESREDDNTGSGSILG